MSEKLQARAEGSLRQRFARLFLRATRKPAASVAEFSQRFEGRTYPPAAPVPASLISLCNVKESLVDGRSVIELTPRRRGTAWHVMYTHGGAFVNPLQAAHWKIVEEIVKATGASITVPLYGLAPEHGHIEAVDFLEKVYLGIVSRVPADRIVLCGDSAGGNLALTQAIRYRDRALPSPGRVVLFSPWLDLGLENPEAKMLEPQDVMLRIEWLREAGRWWSQGVNVAEPHLSPIHATFTGLAPIDIYQGTLDLFLPDARRLHDEVRAVRGKVQMFVTEGGFHVFMGATFTPEARAVYSQMARDLT